MFISSESALDLDPLFIPWDNMNELHILILLLAAKTRCCLVNNWGAASREWREFGEEEAAILSSAQIVCSVPGMGLGPKATNSS